MNSLEINEPVLISIFKKDPVVRSVYFFGSRAVKRSVKNSDYDFAVLVDNKISKEERIDLRLALMDDLSKVFKVDVDVIVINDLTSLFFKYSIIKEGKIIYQKNDVETAEFESRIMGLYFDFQPFLEMYNRAYLNR